MKKFLKNFINICIFTSILSPLTNNVFSFQAKINKNKTALKPFIMNIDNFQWVYKILDDHNINNKLQFFKDDNSLNFLNNFINSDIFQHFITLDLLESENKETFLHFLTENKKINIQLEEEENDMVFASLYQMLYHDNIGIRLWNINDKKNNVLLKKMLFKNNNFELEIIIIIKDKKIFLLSIEFIQILTDEEKLSLCYKYSLENNKEWKIDENIKSFSDNLKFFSYIDDDNNVQINHKHIQYFSSITNQSFENLNDKINLLLDEINKTTEENNIN